MAYVGWKYVWLDKQGKPRRGYRRPEKKGLVDAVYVPMSIWKLDTSIRSYFKTLKRVSPLLKRMAGQKK